MTDIKILVSDIDGTLTDGRLYYGPSGEVMKVFHVHDGMGINLWQKQRRIFALLSARKHESVYRRAEELNIELIGLGISSKLPWLKRELETRGLTFDNLAYIGDDINDIEIMKKAALSAAPADARPEVREIVSYSCKSRGGCGAVREFIDHILQISE